MIKSQVRHIIDVCFQAGVARGLWGESAAGRYTVEVPRHEGQGDFSTNLALVVAGAERKKPRELAAVLKGLLEEQGGIIRQVEVAGPGFVNLFLAEEVWTTVLAPLFREDARFGLADLGQGRRVLVEFVSANPTGPLSIGHGRQAILGDAVARLLEATGHTVQREYYYNDAGRQMRVLGASTCARYLEVLGRPAEFPEDGYQGGYIVDIARGIVEDEGDSLVGADVMEFKARAEKKIFAEIAATLDRLGVRFDSYYNEHTLYEEGLVDAVVADLRAKDLVYQADGATWFKTSALGQEQDRVIIKSSGEPTYRLPDIAYHREKFRRGFDWLVDIFGADHIATVPDVLAGVRALGFDENKVTVILHQFVTLTRDGKQVKMSTRKATFVTVDELLDEVGIDPVRFFFLMRRADSQLEFDLELAKRQSQDNPVYYVQYAHARLCSLLAQARERGLEAPAPEAAPLSLLREPEEIRLLRMIADYPATLRGAALDLEPHRVIFFLMELAGAFHEYYNKHRVLGESAELAAARLCLADGLRRLFAAGLGLLGLSAPASM
ncbi:MAG: arginine--tRNA ligase [Desulfobulbaceae bacterium A2]|nr:MAG: arginine--tRNA ligase [Desulfobulbaceae bacterium A2]